MEDPARILITGVGGFVGRHLVRYLVERGDLALGLGLEPPLVETARLLTANWRLDLLDGDALIGVLSEAKPRAIIHLAGQSSAGLSFDRPIDTFRANALGTYVLLEAVRARCRDTRVLVVGSGEVYGPQPPGTRVEESAPLRPRSPYALSKAAAEAIAEMHATLHGLDVVRTRSFGHVGPGQSDRFVLPSFAQQIARIESGQAGPAVHVGNLDVTRDLCDVRDVVMAYRALLAHGRSGAVYNVCRGVGVRLDEILDRLRSRAKVSIRVERDPERIRPADVPYLVGNPRAIEEDTGWRASIPLERSIDDLLGEWRARF